VDLFMAVIEKAILPLFEVATVIILLAWACLLVLLFLLRRQRRRIGKIFVATSYVTGLYCWLFSVVIAYRTLGLFWLIFGVLAGGLGVIPLAVIGEAVRGLWSSIPEILLAIAMMIAPRFVGLWIVSRS
jgi:hypothetical protein